MARRVLAHRLNSKVSARPTSLCAIKGTMVDRKDQFSQSYQATECILITVNQSYTSLKRFENDDHGYGILIGLG